MTELNQMMEQFVKSGILTEEAVATIVQEFEVAVKEKTEDELTFRIQALKEKLAEEAREVAAKEFRAKEIKIVEEAENYIDLSVKEKIEDKILQLEKDAKRNKEILEEQVLNTVNQYLKTEIMPNVNKIIVEEELAKAKSKLLEESQAKDEAIDQLTKITNNLSKLIQENKSESQSAYLKKVNEMKKLEEELARDLLAEENKIARKAAHARKLHEEAEMTWAEKKAKRQAEKAATSAALNARKAQGPVGPAKKISAFDDDESGPDYDNLEDFNLDDTDDAELEELMNIKDNFKPSKVKAKTSGLAKEIIDYIDRIGVASYKHDKTLEGNFGIKNAGKVTEKLQQIRRDLELPIYYYWSGNKSMADNRKFPNIETLNKEGTPVLDELLANKDIAEQILNTFNNAVDYTDAVGLTSDVLKSIKDEYLGTGTGSGGDRGKDVYDARKKAGGNVRFVRDSDATGAETQRTGKTALERQQERIKKESRRISTAKLKMEQLKKELTSLKEEEKKKIIAAKHDEKRKQQIIQEARKFFREQKAAKVIEEQKKAKAKLVQEQKRIKEAKAAQIRRLSIIEEAREFFVNKKEKEIHELKLKEESRKRDLADKLNQFVEESLKGLKDKDASEVRKQLKGKNFSEIRSSIRSIIRNVVEEGMRAKMARKTKIEQPEAKGKGLIQESLKHEVKKGESNNPYDLASRLI
jgi:hypothetical protein